MDAANHHLWWNRGTWWVAFTVLHDGHRQERIRRPLQTRDVSEARARRDALMSTYERTPGCRLSIRRRQPPVTYCDVQNNRAATAAERADLFAQSEARR